MPEFSKHYIGGSRVPNTEQEIVEEMNHLLASWRINNAMDQLPTVSIPTCLKPFETYGRYDAKDQLYDLAQIIGKKYHYDEREIPANAPPDYVPPIRQRPPQIERRPGQYKGED